MDARAPAMAMSVLLAACAGKPPAPPVPAPAARPAPLPSPTPPPPEPALAAWLDRPLTPGEWSYSGGAAGFAGFGLRCDRGERRVVLTREGSGGPLRIRTSYGDRSLPAGAALPADDPLLDEMAFSRGRFAVEADGAETLIVPAWPEPARVVEDCRG